VVSGAEQTTALLGMPGIGKSTLAAGFARMAQVRRAFPGGVVWLTVGQSRTAHGAEATEIGARKASCIEQIRK